MKKLTNKTLFRFFGISAIIVAGLVIGQFAYAGWNDASGDCPTVSVGNDTTREGTNSDVNGCWSGTNVSARVGDRVVVKVYFRNNTGSTANDVKIKVSDNRNDSGTVNADGYVVVNGSSVDSGSGIIRLPSNSKLVYSKTYVQYKRTGYAYEDKGATTSVFGSGLSVGPITSTLADQGIVKVVYVVESTDDNSDDNSSSSIVATTQSYSWVDEDSGDIKLYGEYDDNDNGSTITYFEYRRDGGSTRSVASGTYSNTSRSFSAVLYNLADGDYDYRACADNGDVDCGNWKSFTIDKNGGYDDDNGDLPTIQTLNPFQVASDFVTFDGYYDMNGCSGKTYFEYGTSTSFGSRTGYISRSSGASGSMTQSVDGLSPNTTYYYRAVAENCEGTVRGSTKSFKTSTRTTIINDNKPIVINGTTTTIRNTTTTTNIGGGARYIRLTIDNGRDTIVRGDELIYDVTWENISKTELNDLVLEVTFPEALQITSTDKGQVDRNANAVYVNIDSLDKLEKDDMTIRARISGTLKDNDPITARAIMAFENPENKAQENAIAYDSDSYLANTNVLGASIFGLDFLPGTLAGWLFIILLLVLLILIIRYATRREEHHHYYRDEVAAPSPTRTVATTTEQKQTEVDYTPYRPTPKDF